MSVKSIVQMASEIMVKRGVGYDVALELLRMEQPRAWAEYVHRSSSDGELKTFSLGGREALRTFDATGGELKVSIPLSELAGRYEVQGLVGPEVMPVVPVPDISGVAPLTGRDAHARIFPIERARGLEANLVPFAVSSAFFSCRGFAAKYPLGIELEENSDAAWGIREGATRFLTSIIRTAKEKETFDFVNSSTNVGTAFTVGSAWNADANPGDPIQAIDTALQRVQDATGFRPNVVCFGNDGWRHFSGNSAAVGKLGNLATPDQAARVFGVERVVVARGMYNAADENMVPSYTPFFGDRVWIGYTGQGEFSPRWGAVASWRPRGLEKSRFYVETIPGKSLHVNWLEVGGWEQPLVIDKDLAVTILGTGSAQAGGI